MNIITSAQSFKNHARYLKNLAKSCKKLCKIHVLHISLLFSVVNVGMI